MQAAMDRQHQSFNIPVQLTGSYAIRAMGFNLPWKLMAVFKRGFYCQNQIGGIVYFGPLSISAGPLNILCEMPERIDWELEGLHPNTLCKWYDDTFWVGSRFGFSFDKALKWEPSSLKEEPTLEMISKGMNALHEKVEKRVRLDGFENLISLVLEEPEKQKSLESPFLQMARGAIGCITQWLANQFSDKPTDCPPIRKGIDTLIGLGPGLTPSGDDFLGGVMISLYSLGFKEVALKMAHIVLARARFRTNKISFVHLSCAARGEGSAAVHNIILNIYENSAQKLKACIDDIDTIGHTSGWDTLAGIIETHKTLLNAKST